MKKTRSAKRKLPAAESIARMADEGRDVSRLFTNSGRMVPPVQRVNVDFTAPMLEELDRQAQELNISRQAVIKTLLRQGLDQHCIDGRPPTRSQSHGSAQLMEMRQLNPGGQTGVPKLPVKVAASSV